jgi:hypothetical protein
MSSVKSKGYMKKVTPFLLSDDRKVGIQSYLIQWL